MFPSCPGAQLCTGRSVRSGPRPESADRSSARHSANYRPTQATCQTLNGSLLTTWRPVCRRLTKLSRYGWRCSRKWSKASRGFLPHWKTVGGTQGVGVNFLEETFSSRTANPKHRRHQQAAREVLKALLPEVGSDIKGHMKSHAELLEVSGYGTPSQ